MNVRFCVQTDILSTWLQLSQEGSFMLTTEPRAEGTMVEYSCLVLSVCVSVWSRVRELCRPRGRLGGECGLQAVLSAEPGALSPSPALPAPLARCLMPERPWTTLGRSSEMRKLFEKTTMSEWGFHYLLLLSHCWKQVELFSQLCRIAHTWKILLETSNYARSNF